MFFWFLFVSLRINFAQSNRCPTNEQMGPCECRDASSGLDVSCNVGLVDEIGVALKNVAATQLHIDYLTLEDVWLPNLPPNFLLGQDVYGIEIWNCSTSSVDKNAFADMAGTLRYLDLNHNALKLVPSQALKKLSYLKTLHLPNNRIKFLHGKAFEGLESLENLTLFGNWIQSIDDSAFVGVNLLYLHLLHNELTDFPGLPLRNQTSLVFLDLDHNKISSLVPEEFHAMGAESLLYLYLAENGIRHLPTGLFRSMGRLLILDISGNDIESIQPSAFEGVEDSLQRLYLDNNRLEEVPSAGLKNLRVMIYLGLSNNTIREIRKDAFIPYGKSLLLIYLSNNSIVHLDPQAFVPLERLNGLLLGSNRLETVTCETFSVLDRLIGLDLHDNPFHCDCRLSWFPDWFKEGYGTIPSRFGVSGLPTEVKCATPVQHENVPLVEIPPDQFVCGNSTTKAPESCNKHALHLTTLQTSFIYLLAAFLICCLIISAVLSSKLSTEEGSTLFRAYFWNKIF